MGTTALNMHERMDGLLYALVHPQKPMVTTRVLDLVHFDQASRVEQITWHILQMVQGTQESRTFIMCCDTWCSFSFFLRSVRRSLLCLGLGFVPR